MARRWALLSATVVVLVGGSAAFGYPPAAPKGTHLVQASLSEPFDISTAGSTDLHFEHVIFPPGASSGWHSHGGPTLGAVKSGTLTVYRASPGGCTASEYAAGQGLFEPANEVLMARNNGPEPVEIYVNHIVAPGVDVTTPAEPAGDCPA